MIPLHLREVSLEIYLDLKRFNNESGSVLAGNGNAVVSARRTALRKYLGNTLLGLEKELNAIAVGDDVDYINHYLRSESNVDNIDELYYMILTECEHRPDTYHLEIILDEGFLTFMESSPSEYLLQFSQGVLQTLYDKGITNTRVVNYYMEQSSLNSKLFKNAI